MSPPLLRVHTDAVIAALAALDLVVGDGKAPEGETGKYAIVYSLPGSSFGTLGDPHADADLMFQVTCVGRSREQAQWVADQAMGLLDGFAVENRKVRVSLETQGGVTRDDDASPPMFYATPRFRVKTTPA